MPNVFESGADSTADQNQPPVDGTQQSDGDAVAKPALTLLSQGDQYDGILALMQASLQNQQLPQDAAFLSDLQIVESSAPFSAAASVPTDGTTATAPADASAGQLQATQDQAVNQALESLAQAMQANPQAVQDNNVVTDLQLITGSGDASNSTFQAAQDAAVNQALSALQDAVQKDPDVLKDPTLVNDLQLILQNAAQALQTGSDTTAQGTTGGQTVQDGTGYAPGSGPSPGGTDIGQAAVPAEAYAQSTDQVPASAAPTDTAQTTTQTTDDPGVLLSQAGIDPTQDTGANEGLIQLLQGNEVAGITMLMKAVQSDPSLLQNQTFLKSLKTVETTLAAQKAAPSAPTPARG